MMGDTFRLLLELVVLFFGVAFLVHISQRWLGEARLRRWMGGPPLLAALKGIGVGFITPFCTYSAIPMLLGLRRAGVSPAGYVAFIVAAPVLDPVLFGALILIVGAKAAVVYALVAFGAALGLALLAERMDVERFLRPVAEPMPLGSRAKSSPAPPTRLGADGCGDESCGDRGAEAWRGLRLEAEDAAAAALSLLRSLGPILLIGVGIGLGIELVIPPEAVGALTGEGSAWAVPVAAGLGTPLYFNTELFVPIADSLAAVGVGVGAIVALTIAGAGANVPEFVILSKLVHRRALAMFIGYVFVVAMVGGLLAEAV